MFSKGDAVQHKQSGEVGVVVGTTAKRVEVQTAPGVTIFWYKFNIQHV